LLLLIFTISKKAVFNRAAETGPSRSFDEYIADALWQKRPAI